MARKEVINLAGAESRPYSSAISNSLDSGSRFSRPAEDPVVFCGE